MLVRIDIIYLCYVMSLQQVTGSSAVTSTVNMAVAALALAVVSLMRE